MPEIITSHLTHFAWAAVCLIVALLVHFWPTIKTKIAAGWVSLKAAFQKDEAKTKAVAELVEQAVAAEVKKVADATSASVLALVTRIETLEKALAAAIEAQVQADVAKAGTTIVNNLMAAASPGPAPAAEPAAPGAALSPEAEAVHGWVPPAAAKV